MWERGVCYHASVSAEDRGIGRAVSGTRTTDFGGRLRRLREAAGLTQEELASKAGPTAKAISALERGERKKAVETLNAGLRLQSNHKQINTILDRIGRRKRPVIPFLPRSNSLNIWLGKLLRGRTTRG